MRRVLVSMALAVALAGCRRPQAPAPPAPAAAPPEAAAPASSPAPPPAVAAPAPAPPPAAPSAELPRLETAPVPPPPEEPEDHTLYRWTDADGGLHYTTGDAIPADRRSTARPAGGRLTVVEPSGAAGWELPRRDLPPPPPPPADAAPQGQGPRPQLDAEGLPIPGTMEDTAATRAANQQGGHLDPASMERRRALDNRRMRCRQVDGATICDGE